MRRSLHQLTILVALLFLFSPAFSQEPTVEAEVTPATDATPAVAAPPATDATPATEPTPATDATPTTEAIPAAVTPASVEFTLQLGQNALLHGSQTTVAMVEVKGAETASTTRTPVTMAVVIDASGSMRGDKMEDAQAAAHALIDQLAEGDRLSIISYDTRVTTHLAISEIGADRSAAHAAVNAIEPRGNTCVSCGIAAGYESLTTAPYSHVRRLVMLSDGNANRGVTDSTQLGEQAQAARETQHSATSTIGIGTDYNEEILSSISAGGSGAFYFLHDSAEIASVLQRELASLASTVATSVAVELRPAEGVTLGDSSSLGATREGDSVLFNLGQIAAGDVRRLLVPVTVGEGVEGSVVTATATYTPVDGAAASADLVALVIRTEDGGLAESSRNTAVLEHAQRIEAALDIELAMRDFAQGDRTAARRRLRERQNQLEGAASAMGGNIALEAEAEEVSGLLDELDEDVDGDRARGLYLQNRSRGEEIRSGVPAEQMYHQETVY